MRSVKQEIQSRYDHFANLEMAGGASEISPARAYFWSRKLSTALQMGGFRPGDHLLEIGCARGQMTSSLTKAGYRVTGIDLSPRSIAVAQRHMAQGQEGRIQFFVGDAENLSRFPDGSFDGAVSFSTLRYVPDLPRALLEIHRVLKPGAHAVVDFPNRWCPWFYVKQWLGSERHVHDHWFSSPQVERFFLAAGFREPRVRKILFTPTALPEAWLGLFRGIDRFAEPIPWVRELSGILMVAGRRP